MELTGINEYFVGKEVFIWINDGENPVTNEPSSLMVRGFLVDYVDGWLFIGDKNGNVEHGYTKYQVKGISLAHDDDLDEMLVGFEPEGFHN